MSLDWEQTEKSNSNVSDEKRSCAEKSTTVARIWWHHCRTLWKLRSGTCEWYLLSWTRFHGTIMCDLNALEAQRVQTTIYLLCAHMDEKKKWSYPPKKNWRTTSERIMKKNISAERFQNGSRLNIFWLNIRTRSRSYSCELISSWQLVES